MLLLAQVSDTEQFVVIHKPAGMAVHSGDGSVLDVLEDHATLGGGGRLHPVHRIDAETTGLLLLGKTSAAAAMLQKALAAPQTVKVYAAVLRGVPEPRTGIWEQPLSKRPEGRRNPQGASRERVPALTRYDTLDANRWLSLVKMRLGTGRQHQIRRHTALNRHAVVGDRRYCEPKFSEKLRGIYHFEGMALHAAELRLHVSDTEQYAFAMQLPNEWECFGLG